MLRPGLAPQLRRTLAHDLTRAHAPLCRPAARVSSVMLRQRVSCYSSATSSYPEASASEPPKWYQRPLTLLLAFVPVFTFGLGVWQIKRLRWKLDLIDELEDKLKREPLELPRNVDLEMLMEHYTNRLFNIPGKFPTPDLTNSIFLGPRVRDGQMGYHVVQPLSRRTGGADVIVDRGFVAKEKIIMGSERDPTTWRLPDTSKGTSTGPHLLLLPREKQRNSFTPPNDPSKYVWYFADVNELRPFFEGRPQNSRGKQEEEEDAHTPSAGIGRSVKEMLGLEKNDVMPVLMEEVFEGNAYEASQLLKAGQPIGRPATVELRNQHAVYAATWFSLSGATSVMLALLLRRAPR